MTASLSWIVVVGTK